MFTIKVTAIAMPVVNRKVNIGHLILLVSLFIVKSVVPQGK